MGLREHKQLQARLAALEARIATLEQAANQTKAANKAEKQKGRVVAAA